jgi:hypothetical protein
MEFLPDVTPAPLPTVPEVILKEKGEFDEKGPPDVLTTDNPMDVVDYDDEEPDDVPIEPKSILRNSEVFREVKKKVEMSPEPDLVVQPIQGAPRPPNLTKKGRAKRPASDKQKEHLKKARIKALETRRRNKKAKDEANGIFDDTPPTPAPAPQPPPPQPKQPPPVSRPEPQPSPEPVFMGYTQDEMNEAVFNGIQQYDGLRKTQKKEKKARLAKEEHDRRVVAKIAQAVGPTHQTDPWSSVFTFS